MLARLSLLLAVSILLANLHTEPLDACCAVSRVGQPVVNADQSVIILWDAATKTQHFIRRASFKSEADDFGFLVPSPTQPELSESGNDAFPFLGKLTEPETKTRPRPISFGCSVAATRDVSGLTWSSVKVLEEKTVAGFNAAVLEAKSATALVQWLKEHGYAFSSEVEAWAKPYIEKGWKITALKVAKDKDNAGKTVAASALRMSFKTDRPLFPYREPAYHGVNEKLGASQRLLRIYFLADARYQGELTKEKPWTGKTVWAGKVSAKDRSKLLELLKLPEAIGPAQWWLTEFEDDWSYQLAPADVTFTRAAKQDTLRRPPIIRYASNRFPADLSLGLLAVAAFAPALYMRMRRRFTSAK
jgi:hypothetical protein